MDNDTASLIAQAAQQVGVPSTQNDTANLIKQASEQVGAQQPQEPFYDVSNIAKRFVSGVYAGSAQPLVEGIKGVGDLVKGQPGVPWYENPELGPTVRNLATAPLTAATAIGTFGIAPAISGAINAAGGNAAIEKGLSYVPPEYRDLAAAGIEIPMTAIGGKNLESMKVFGRTELNGSEFPGMSDVPTTSTYRTPQLAGPTISSLTPYMENGVQSYQTGPQIVKAMQNQLQTDGEAVGNISDNALAGMKSLSGTSLKTQVLQNLENAIDEKATSVHPKDKAALMNAASDALDIPQKGSYMNTQNELPGQGSSVGAILSPDDISKLPPKIQVAMAQAQADAENSGVREPENLQEIQQARGKFNKAVNNPNPLPGSPSLKEYGPVLYKAINDTIDANIPEDAGAIKDQFHAASEKYSNTKNLYENLIGKNPPEDYQLFEQNLLNSPSTLTQAAIHGSPELIKAIKSSADQNLGYSAAAGPLSPKFINAVDKFNKTGSGKTIYGDDWDYYSNLADKIKTAMQPSIQEPTAADTLGKAAEIGTYLGGREGWAIRAGIRKFNPFSKQAALLKLYGKNGEPLVQNKYDINALWPMVAAESVEGAENEQK